MNGKHRRPARLLADPTATTIVVEHRDRLARFGVDNLQVVLAAQVAVDLAHDMTQVLTSFCARLYGRRGARNQAGKARRAARRNLGPAELS